MSQTHARTVSLALQKNAKGMGKTMLRVVDNKDGSILAICFSPIIAQLLVDNLPVEGVDGEDEDFKRFAWEDCSQHPQQMIGHTLKILGESIQLSAQKNSLVLDV